MLRKEKFWKDVNFDRMTGKSPDYFYHTAKNQNGKKGVLIACTTGNKAAGIANQSVERKAEMTVSIWLIGSSL